MQTADFDTTRITPEMLTDARRNARLTPCEAAHLCGIHRTSYQRQENGQSRVNVTAYRLIMMSAGWLPAPFDGWSIGQGKLWTPENVAIEPGEIQALPMLYAQLAELKRRLRDHNPTVNAPDLANVVPFRRIKTHEK